MVGYEDIKKATKKKSLYEWQLYEWTVELRYTRTTKNNTFH